MEGHAPTQSKDAPGFLSVWPEKTSRKLIAIVVAALLLGVPVLSMTLMSVHVDRQVIEIEPESYRAFHMFFYGYGWIEYSFEGVTGSDIYILELDRVNYYRFIMAEESFDYEAYRRVSVYGHGSSGTGGLILDEYLVLVNKGAGTAQIEFELDARAYFSLLPAAAILLTASAIGYWIGRREDRRTGLDTTSPIMIARKAVRARALTAMALLTALPLVFMLAVPAAVPDDAPRLMVLTMNAVRGLVWGMCVSVIMIFLLRFRLTKEQRPPNAVLKSLAYRLRASGYRVTEEDRRLIVRISSTSSVHIRAKEVPDGALVLYKASATPKGFAILIVLFLTTVGSPLALVLALFMLYRASAFASMRVLPRLPELPVQGAGDAEPDTRRLIVESLSEARRLSAEAYESSRSSYHDRLIILAIVGLLLGPTVWLMSIRSLDNSERGFIVALAGIVCAVAFTAVTCWWLSSRSRPVISEIKGWSTRLDAALSREVAGQGPSDSEPSSFELIAESLKVMPGWLKARRRAGGFRQPLYWILMFFQLYFALFLGLAGIIGLAEGEVPLGAISLGAGVGLALVAFLTYRIWKKIVDQEYESTLSWWNDRREALRSEMEKILAGE